jgi:hypothetical protein
MSGTQPVANDERLLARNPLSTSRDPGERAAASVEAVLRDALNRRLARH